MLGLLAITVGSKNALSSRSTDSAVIPVMTPMNGSPSSRCSPSRAWPSFPPTMNSRQQTLVVGDFLDRPFAVAADGTPSAWRSYSSFDVQRDERSRVGGEARSILESLATVAYGNAVDTFPSTAAELFRHPGVTYVPLRDAESSSLALVSDAHPSSEDLVKRFREVTASIVDHYLHLVPGAVRLGPDGSAASE